MAAGLSRTIFRTSSSVATSGGGADWPENTICCQYFLIADTGRRWTSRENASRVGAATTRSIGTAGRPSDHRVICFRNSLETSSRRRVTAGFSGWTMIQYRASDEVAVGPPDSKHPDVTRITNPRRLRPSKLIENWRIARTDLARVRGKYLTRSLRITPESGPRHGRNRNVGATWRLARIAPIQAADPTAAGSTSDSMRSRGARSAAALSRPIRKRSAERGRSWMSFARPRAARVRMTAQVASTSHHSWP